MLQIFRQELLKSPRTPDVDPLRMNTTKGIFCTSHNAPDHTAIHPEGGPGGGRRALTCKT